MTGSEEWKLFRESPSTENIFDDEASVEREEEEEEEEEEERDCVNRGGGYHWSHV